MDGTGAHARARARGVRPLVYWPARTLVQLFGLVYFRMARLGREHLPARGPVIIAANHRSFLDPFLIGCMARRPMYYVAKEELFASRAVTWLLSALGAFPVRRGHGDSDAIATATALLERGEAVLIFPEGTRIRPGGLGRARRGVGRLALLSGAPVVPVAISGTEDVRRGWRIRPSKVRIRAGRPLAFPRVADPSPQLATAVTDRIWPCVMLQWEWLGGTPPLRRAAVIGDGERAARVAAVLRRAGVETQEGAGAFSRHDLVCFAVDDDALPGALAEHAGEIPDRAGVLVFSERPDAAARVRERVHSTAVAALQDAPEHAPCRLESPDPRFARVVADCLRAGGVEARPAPPPRATVLRLPARPTVRRRVA